MNSGKDGQELVGTWDLSLPVIWWRAWYWVEGIGLCSRSDSWDELPDRLLLVYVYHGDSKKTRMVCVDVYPPPPGCGTESKLGYQLGEVFSKEWLDVRSKIESEA